MKNLQNKNKKQKIIFYGRPDGLGNRYEELLLLSNYAVENNLYFKYFWNNTGKWKYTNKFSAKNIEIVEVDYVRKWPTNNFESTKYWRDYISTNDIFHNNNVTLDLNLQETQNKYIGVLARGSDRIVNNNELLPPGFQNFEDVKRSIKLTKEYLISKKEQLPIVIFSEDKELKKYVSTELKQFKQITLPQISSIEQAYQDLINLLAAKEIILCSKFSSFALTAGLISNKKVIKFYSYSHPLLNRWKNEYINFPFEKDKVDYKTLDLPKFTNEEKVISIGNNFIKSYMIPRKILKNISVLVSYNKSKYIGFEENFKLLKNSVNIHMTNTTIFFTDLEEIINILKNNKNRKNQLKIKLAESKKTKKIFGIKSYFLKFRQFRTYNNNYFIFIDIDTLADNLNHFFNDSCFTGAIATFDNFQKKSKLINKIIDSNNDYIFHSQIEKDKNNSGYISFYKDSLV